MEILFNYLQLIICYMNLIYLCDNNYGDFYTDAEREINGFFRKTFIDIKNADEEKFKKLTRFSVEKFNFLFGLLKGNLTKRSYRPAIDAECRLALTLIYLAHGDSRNMLSMTFRTSPTSVRRIIYETCGIIWDELRCIYLATPNGSELEEIAKSFFAKTGVPQCVGAIDGKHINIVRPPGAGSEYYNYKGHHSVVLLAACDANYLFTFVDIGAQGSESDGGVFSSSTFGQRVINNEIDMPCETHLPGSSESFPYFFVADAAFPLRRNIMKPYPGRLLADAESRYNYKISSARRFIENAFGIMCARWRIMYQSLNCRPQNAVKIVKAVVVLHNFIKLHDPTYCPPNFVDHEENQCVVPGGWRSEISSLPSFHMAHGNNARREAFILRDKLRNYFTSNMN